MSAVPAIEVATGAHVQFSVIWLHGLGADGSDFVPLVQELGLDKTYGLRFIFPHAPYRAVTCNGGYEMRAWYDILSLEPNSRRIDERGLIESCEAVNVLIQRENERGIPSRHIFLAGFSQGGAVAYLTALSHPERLGGLVALSTYIPSPKLQLAEAASANRDLPILAIHGSHDDVVSPSLGKAARDLLREAGYAVTWREFPMPHSVCLEEAAVIGEWFNARCREFAQSGETAAQERRKAN